MSVISNRKIISIIAITWILSLVTTIVLFQFFSGSLSLANNSIDGSSTQIIQSNVKIVKLIQQEEKNITGVNIFLVSETDDPRQVEFSWIPQNIESNMILNAYVNFEYRCGEPPEKVWSWDGNFWWHITSWLKINEFEQSSRIDTEEYHGESLSEWQLNNPSLWKTKSYKIESSRNWNLPNQESYNIVLFLSHEDRAAAQTPTYVRNIEIILEVIDG